MGLRFLGRGGEHKTMREAGVCLQVPSGRLYRASTEVREGLASTGLHPERLRVARDGEGARRLALGPTREPVQDSFLLNSASRPFSEIKRHLFLKIHVRSEIVD